MVWGQCNKKKANALKFSYCCWGNSSVQWLQLLWITIDHPSVKLQVGAFIFWREELPGRKVFVIHTCVSYHLYIYICMRRSCIHILFKNAASNMENDGYFPTLKRKIMKTPQSKEKQFKVHGKPAMILQKHPPYIVGSWGSNRDPNQQAS